MPYPSYTYHSVSFPLTAFFFILSVHLLPSFLLPCTTLPFTLVPLPSFHFFSSLPCPFHFPTYSNSFQSWISFQKILSFSFSFPLLPFSLLPFLFRFFFLFLRLLCSFRLLLSQSLSFRSTSLPVLSYIFFPFPSIDFPPSTKLYFPSLYIPRPRYPSLLFFLFSFHSFPSLSIYSFLPPHLFFPPSPSHPI